MATNPGIPLFAGYSLNTGFSSVYIVPDNVSRVIIDAAVINNYSSSNITYSVRYSQIGTPTQEFNEIITNRDLRAGDNDGMALLIGQAIKSGGRIQVQVSALNSANLQMTGTEILL